MVWLNRIGMLLEVLALLLASPEILGEERLRKIENILESWLPFIQKVMLKIIDTVLIALHKMEKPPPGIEFKLKIRTKSDELMLYVIFPLVAIVAFWLASVFFPSLSSFLL